LVLITILLIVWNGGDAMGKLTLGQILLGILSYSMSTLVGELVVEDHGELCQITGALTNVGMLTFPFGVMVRYAYFYTVVVLEKPIGKRWWISAMTLFWVLAHSLSLSIAKASLYHKEQGIPFCSIPFHSSNNLIILSTGLYLGLMILGGLTHSMVSYCILKKSQPKLGKCQRTRSAILAKFIPVAVIYQTTHLLFIIYTFYQFFTRRSLPYLPNFIYAIVYAIATLVSPITILLTNKHLYQPLTSYFLYSD
ncbi:hypothetical protein L0F63_005569, partial [Massospora cicadina]